MTQQKMQPANATPSGPASVTIDLGTQEALIVNLGDTAIKMWPMKEHIYKEYVQSVPALANLLPKNGEQVDKDELMKRTSKDENAGIAIMWSFIRCSIDSLDDYTDLRRRIYGLPNDEDLLDGVEHITMDDIAEIPEPSEPLSLVHMVRVMYATMEHFRPEFSGTSDK